MVVVVRGWAGVFVGCFVVMVMVVAAVSLFLPLAMVVSEG